MIEVEGLWKSYDAVVTIRDFTLAVDKSQTLGIIGPNGSGKTTLLRMLATLAKPDQGSLRVCGFDALGAAFYDLKGIAPARRHGAGANIGDMGQRGPFVFNIPDKGLNGGLGPLQQDGDTGGGVGHLSVQPQALGQLKNKGPETNALNNAVDLQPPGGNIGFHGEMSSAIGVTRDLHRSLVGTVQVLHESGGFL